MFFKEVPSLHTSEISHRREAVFLPRMWEMFFIQVQSLQTSEISHRGEAVFLS
ncbi:unnamed protein product [Staurois parvus]|uniref:Uncharacterized protein n=1 Tax=Staurois parvus TaxID=386267 RepID=A0ABN9ARG0_9NEOB|nr:unnamed protein product [Staurois parvus]